MNSCLTGFRLQFLLTLSSAFKEIGELVDLVEEMQDVLEPAAEQLQFTEHVLFAEPELAALSWRFVQTFLNNVCKFRNSSGLRVSRISM